MNSAEAETARPEIDLGPLTYKEIDGTVDLMLMRPPAYWMGKVSVGDIRTFLEYAIGSPHSLILAARPKGGASPGGYVFALVDAPRFWAGFSIRNPVLAASIVYHWLMRARELRRRNENLARENAAAAMLPKFSWSPSRLGYARIIGLYIRKEHHNKGLAMDLYFALFDALREKGCPQVEEYAAPNYADFAGKFPKVCGWSLQPCVCGGYKISRAL